MRGWAQSATCSISAHRISVPHWLEEQPCSAGYWRGRRRRERSRLWSGTSPRRRGPLSRDENGYSRNRTVASPSPMMTAIDGELVRLRREGGVRTPELLGRQSVVGEQSRFVRGRQCAVGLGVHGCGLDEGLVVADDQLPLVIPESLHRYKSRADPKDANRHPQPL